MLRKLAIAALLCSAMGTAHAAPDGAGLGRIPVLGGLLQGLLPGGVAYVPVLGIPIPAISTEPLLGIVYPLLHDVVGPIVVLGGSVVSPLLSGLGNGAQGVGARSLSGTTLPVLGNTLPGLLPPAP